MNIIKITQTMIDELNNFKSKANNKSEEYKNLYIDSYTNTIKGYVDIITQWAKNGYKTFSIGEKLLNAFKNTYIPTDLKIDELKFPFPSFIVESSIPLLTFVEKFDGEEVNCNIDGIAYSYEFDDVWKEMVNAITLTMFLTHKNGHQVRAISRFNICKNESIEDWLCQSEKEKLELKTPIYMNNDVCRKIFNIFFNTILYINDTTRIPKETEIHQIRKLNNGPS